MKFNLLFLFLVVVVVNCLLSISLIEAARSRSKSKSRTKKSGPLQCLDDEGKPVDWFIIYKYPYLKHQSHKNNIFGGYRYAYITSQTEHDGWQLSSYKITDDHSILGRTLAPYFSSKRSQITSLFYNDQPPNGKEVPSTYAHAKGLLLANQDQGFWLIHTVPKFVELDEKYSYVSTGGRYGQVAMCLSLSNDQLTKVVRENFLVSRPYVYGLYIAQSMEKQQLAEALVDLEHHRWDKTKDFTTLDLKTLGGQSFRSFYKNPKFEVDLYTDIVAKQYKTSLRVETWRHPPGDPLDSECDLKQTEVENIERIQISFDDQDDDQQGQFSSYDDHSKWAISRDHQLDLVCIGDLNRVHSQFKRGGGTTCIQQANVWSNFNRLINKVDKCKDDHDPPNSLKTNNKKKPATKFWTEVMNEVKDYMHYKEQ